MFSCGHWIVSAKGAHEPKVQTVGAYPSFLSMEHAYIATLPLDGMLVHCRVTPSSVLPLPIYTPG